MAFSSIELKMQQAAAQAAEKILFAPASAGWSAEERTPDAVSKRLERSQDFWYFDRIYFSPEMHTDYAKPCAMHKAMLEHVGIPGIHVEAGPRDHAKTAYGLKILVHGLLTGRFILAGTYSHTLTTSSRLLSTVASLIKDNPRIMHDWGVAFIEDNDEEIRFRTNTDWRQRVVAAFSEGKSVRGFTVLFGRPQFILGDDVETLSSPLSEDHVEERIKRIQETFGSLEKRAGVLMWLGNNFDVRCAINKLKIRFAKGTLAPHWHIHIWRAWDRLGRCALWPQRFKVKSEAQLRALLKPSDDPDWEGNFQQDPIEDEGEIFPSHHYAEWIELSEDARGVTWCDPNLALKAKGDTTAMGALLFSPTTQRLYVVDPHGESYSDPNDLLARYLRLKTARVVRMGFDGNVSQESNWTAHVRNYCSLHKIPPPYIEYRRYNVDLCAKNAQMQWAAGNILFPPGFKESAIGARFTQQIFSFRGKKRGAPDDAPDWLISAVELITELKIVRPAATPGKRKAIFKRRED